MVVGNYQLKDLPLTALDKNDWKAPMQRLLYRTLIGISKALGVCKTIIKPRAGRLPEETVILFNFKTIRSSIINL